MKIDAKPIFLGRLHSTVDLITNSSTSIYTTADTQSVKAYKQFIDAILKRAGSDKTCDDLFNVVRERDFDEDYVIDMLEEELAGGVSKLVAFLTPEELVTIGNGEYDGIAPIVRRLVANETTKALLPQNPEDDAYYVSVLDKEGKDIECIMRHIDGKEYAN